MNRRQLLRAAGASLCLPFLPSAPGAAAESLGLRRQVWFFVPNGFLTPALTPTATGPDYALPPALAALGPLRSRLSLWSGLRNLADANGERYGFSTHEACTASLLTDTPLAGDYYTRGARNGISVDQYAVRELRPATPYASLQLGTGERWINGGGTIDVLYNHLSWANDVTPLAPLVDPKAVFDGMFGGADATATAEEQARRQALRTSVLDAVNDRTRALSARLDAADRAKLEQHTTAVRELELRLEGLAEVECDPGPEPGADLAFPARLDAMLGIVRVALTCDLTRIATMMSATTTALTTFPWLGISTDHHTLSHNQAYLERDRQDYLTVQGWFAERFAAFCQSLADVPEGDGDLLSTTQVTMLSEFGDGNAHVASPMIVFTAGGEASGIRHGRHEAAAGVPHANFLRASLRHLGADPDGFGTTATGTLDLT